MDNPGKGNGQKELGKSRWSSFAVWDKGTTNFLLSNYKREEARCLIAVYFALCWLKSDAMEYGLKAIEIDGLAERCSKYAFMEPEEVEDYLEMLGKAEILFITQEKDFNGEEIDIFFTDTMAG